ncbi:hypothetical protein HJG60_008796 [Phyllostomus discolor]|uniref:Uncharacterized protein n=1 Tax=Phyllostomus discolor TaxID=89673 RepID=A0A833YSI3_9CHIR|nr:hypothetical protein HJG60_008796 [Phyllostomus discolor]
MAGSRLLPDNPGSLPLNVSDIQICDIHYLELWGPEASDGGRDARPWKSSPPPSRLIFQRWDASHPVPDRGPATCCTLCPPSPEVGGTALDPVTEAGVQSSDGAPIKSAPPPPAGAENPGTSVSRSP